MNNWPSISNPSYPLSEIISKPRFKSPDNSGYVDLRETGTVFVRQYELVWRSIPESEYQTLATFFENNQGLFFNWTRPFDGQALVCRFLTDKLNSTVGIEGFRDASVNIESIPEVKV